jgi:hypothetical protein
MLDLAGRRELETLFDAALGLQLGHFVSSAPLGRDIIQPPRQPLLAGPLVFPTIWKARAYKVEAR